jgi:perosamine synthetase
LAEPVDIDRLVGALRDVVGEAAPLHAPDIAGQEWAYVKECLDTGWVSTAGAYVTRFEKMLADYTGARHAIAVANGTAALHACLMATGVERDEEVICPAATFVATANAIAYQGAVPHFADIRESDLGLNPDKLSVHLKTNAERRADGLYNKQTGRRIAAVLVMHTFGHPADLDALLELSGRFGLPLVEDAAESLGSFYRGKHTGRFGLVSALSFNGNKIVTTGGGGALLTEDDALAARMRHLTTTAKQPHRWEFIHDEVGYNYRLPNVNAAIGCGQMEQLPRFVQEKRGLARRYIDILGRVPGLSVVAEPDGSQSNYWLNVILLDRANASQRDAVLEATNAAGLMTRPLWRPMHLLPMYAGCPRMDLSATEDVYGRLINLPSSAALGRNL